MALRWLHKTWTTFWYTVGIVLSVLVVLIGVGYLTLQLPGVKKSLLSAFEERINTNINGYVSIERLEGSIPFEFSFVGVSVYADTANNEPIFFSDSIATSVDISGLLSSQLQLNVLDIYSPNISLDASSGNSIGDFLNSESNGSPDSLGRESRFANWSVLVPRLLIHDGNFELENLDLNQEQVLGTENLTLADIQLDLFLEINARERFIDIEKLEFGIPELNVGSIDVFGQVFNDSRFLELNAFSIRSENTNLRLNGEVDGVDLLEPDVVSQFEASTFTFQIGELALEPSTIRKVYPEFPEISQQLNLSSSAVGSIDSVNVEQLFLQVGNSSLSASGLVTPLNLNEYQANIEELRLDSADIANWIPSFTSEQQNALTSSDIEGFAVGSDNSFSFEVQMLSDRGDAEFVGMYSFVDSVSSRLDVFLDSVNIGGLITNTLTSTNLTGELNLVTDSFEPDSANGELNIAFENGVINALPYDSLKIQSDWEEGISEPEFRMNANETLVSGSGFMNLQDSVPSFAVSGMATQVDLKRLTQYHHLAEAILDVTYDLELIASDLENAFGQLTIDIPAAIVGGDTLAAHQIYADYNSSATSSQVLRITSTGFDLSLDGKYDPSYLLALSKHWGSFFEDRVYNEILFKDGYGVEPGTFIDSVDQNFEIQLDVKDALLLKAYFPVLPQVETHASITSNFNMNRERLLFNASLIDENTSFYTNSIDSLALQITGSFRHNESLKTFSSVRAQLEAARFTTDFSDGEGVSITFDMDEDSVQIASQMSRFSEDTEFNLNTSIQLSDTTIAIELETFELGNNIYQWVNEGTPLFVFNDSQKLIFNDFLFTNAEELFSFDGVFSGEPEDSVSYTIQNVNLKRISDLVDGRVDFSGILDGDFTTKSLTRVPSIQGNLGISGLSISDRVVGDLDIASNYNSERNRFDTRVEVRTDSAKYPSYFTRNDRVGQNIILNGHVLAPETTDLNSIDSLFYFDLDFESIDLWVLPFIAPRVFTEMSGVASGEGEIWGNFSEFDYNVDYEIGVDDAVFIQPKFLDTYYFALGSVNLNRRNGLQFEDMFIIDPSGGMATLSGNYDLGDLSRVHELNLILEMDEFQFLNNTFDPDVSFFGDAYGSTTISITGTNLNPVITTLTPLRISDYSNIGIPLLEETEFDETSNFIQFVEDFNLQDGANSSSNESGDLTDLQNESDDPFQRSFIERFTMDLQFVTDVPMKVQLIFDPITGDIIEADGTGRLGIRLEDQQISMFGQFDISGGEYQFVVGEIVSRRFNLEPGGSIIWEGAPGNARVDLSAFYQGRPDLNILSQTGTTDSDEESQRVPVQLVLDVGGTLTAIENDFYFRMPSTFELQQNTTTATVINNLNRNEDEKLIQATSFLLMGEFIPSSSTSSGLDAANSFTDSFSSSGAVLNPLLSSQVISPLLSNQVNSLLRSDVGTLDIDVNLNTYNDVDLAVALRLYNDRIILSREGLITGSQSGIGDLGATYRINQTLSVTAFHRQDPTFGTISSSEETQQSQDINGVGVEAKVNFNSWDEFFRRLTNPFRRLFGKKDDSESVASTEQN